MSLRIALLISLLAALPASAQGVLGDDGVYVLAEVAPAPVGGMAALTDRLVYPEAALDAGAEGTVVVTFIVEPDGALRDVAVQRTPHEALGEAALAALAEVAFEPGRVGDDPVPTRVSLPIRFALPPPEEVVLEGRYASQPARPIGGWDTFLRTVEWPEEAARTGVEGVFTLSVTVDPEGHVVEAEIVEASVERDDGRLEAIGRPRHGALPHLVNVDDRPSVSSVRSRMEQALLRALYATRFVPAVENGEVVTGTVVQTVEYYLHG